MYGDNFSAYSWGELQDRDAHLIKAARPIFNEGLPPLFMKPVLLQVFFVGQHLLLGPFESKIAYTLFKVTCFPILFGTFYILMYMGREFFNISEKKYLVLIVLAAAFLGSLNLPFDTFGQDSAYGFFLNFTGYYHNTTLLYSNLFGLLAITFYFLDFEFDLKKGFFIASFFSVVSFFFKPSFYTLLAPAFFLMMPLYIHRLRKEHFFGAALLVFVPVFWKYYPVIFEIKGSSLSYGIEFCRLWSLRMSNKFPSVIYSNSHLCFLTLMIFSFPLIIPVAIDWIVSLIKKKAWRCELFRCGKVRYFYSLFLF